MKISNSKKQLARIISENGGWRDGARFAAQDSKKDSYPSRVCFYRNKPVLDGTRWLDGGHGMVGDSEACIEGANQLFNWHQTILSRDEYFHLYPAPDAGVKVEVENRTSCRLTVTDGPTIEQLAADYRAKLAIAQRALEEADSHRCGAEAALEKLVAAGKALGLVLSVAAPEPELVITDWRDLQVGDEIEYLGGTSGHWVGRQGTVALICHDDDEYPILFQDGPEEESCDPRDWMSTRWCDSFRFIRRPTKGDTNA